MLHRSHDRKAAGPSVKYCCVIRTPVIEILIAAGLIVTTAVLVSASMHDLRSREVPDIHWAIICIAGLVLLTAAAFDGGVTIQRMMILAGACLVVADILYDKERSPVVDTVFYAAVAVSFAVPIITTLEDTFVQNTLAIPICYMLFVILFYAGVLVGGADVKCLISLAIIFPMYPAAYGIPVIDIPAADMIPSIVSFPLTVLLYASVISMLLMIPMAVRNIRRGDTEFPNMLLGYRIDAGEAEELYVWPMAEKKKKGVSPEDTDGAGKASTSAPESSDGKIWVTPKIPFILPITAAVVITAVIGNVIFLL